MRTRVGPGRALASGRRGARRRAPPRPRSSERSDAGVAAERPWHTLHSRMVTVRSVSAASGFVALATAAACLPGAGPALDPYQDDAGTAPPISFGDDSGVRLDVDLGPSFAVAGLQPSHGPWTGGTRTTIAGRGFSSNIQVRIGA